MKINTTFCLAIIATLTITGCKSKISAELYTSDIIAAAEGENLTAPIVISLEMSSKNKCMELAPHLTTALQTQFSDVQFIGCQTERFNDFARFKTQVKLVVTEGLPTETKAAFAIAVRKQEEEYGVYYLSSTTATRAIWDALPKDITTYTKYEPKPSLSAVLNNDLRNTIIFSVDNVFADGHPVQRFSSNELPRRGRLELVMSDVTNAAFGKYGEPSYIVSFKEAK